MYYELKNGKSVQIRKPCIDDAEQIIDVMKTADEETKFLARNPGEFKATVEQEKNIIESVINDDFGRMWFVPEYDGKIIGQCSVGVVRNNERYLHRASVAFVLLKEYWGLGIGGKICTILVQKHLKQQGLFVGNLYLKTVKIYLTTGRLIQIFNLNMANLSILLFYKSKTF